MEDMVTPYKLFRVLVSYQPGSIDTHGETPVFWCGQSIADVMLCYPDAASIQIEMMGPLYVAAKAEVTEEN